MSMLPVTYVMLATVKCAHEPKVMFARTADYSDLKVFLPSLGIGPKQFCKGTFFAGSLSPLIYNIPNCRMTISLLCMYLFY